jgi:hypothetical protein
VRQKLNDSPAMRQQGGERLKSRLNRSIPSAVFAARRRRSPADKAADESWIRTARRERAMIDDQRDKSRSEYKESPSTL